jgi:2,3-bisphosphoglycerate-dependent phosphoglycerate mutase
MKILMKKLICLFFLGVSFSTHAQIKIVLLRHSVKAETAGRDPELSVEGKRYAALLDKFFTEEKFDGAYATPFKRTQQTIQPLALRNQLAIRDYGPVDGKGLLAKIQENKQKSVIVAGHSNTLHHLVNFLVPEANMKELEETDYGKIFMITWYPDRPAQHWILSTADWLENSERGE